MTTTHQHLSPSTRNTQRFSTYSGAPSLHPSLTPTLETASTHSARNSTHHTSSPTALLSEKDTSPTTMPSTNASTSTLGTSTDPKTADLKTWSGALQRMRDSRLEKQRFVMDESKTDEVAKLALGAKVERALARRMSGQDAVFRPATAASAAGGKRVVEVKAV